MSQTRLTNLKKHKLPRFVLKFVKNIRTTRSIHPDYKRLTYQSILAQAERLLPEARAQIENEEKSFDAYKRISGVEDIEAHLEHYKYYYSDIITSLSCWHRGLAKSGSKSEQTRLSHFFSEVCQFILKDSLENYFLTSIPKTILSQFSQNNPFNVASNASLNAIKEFDDFYKKFRRFLLTFLSLEKAFYKLESLLDVKADSGCYLIPNDHEDLTDRFAAIKQGCVTIYKDVVLTKAPLSHTLIQSWLDKHLEELESLYENILKFHKDLRRYEKSARYNYRSFIKHEQSILKLLEYDVLLKLPKTNKYIYNQLDLARTHVFRQHPAGKKSNLNKQAFEVIKAKELSHSILQRSSLLHSLDSPEKVFSSSLSEDKKNALAAIYRNLDQHLENHLRSNNNIRSDVLKHAMTRANNAAKQLPLQQKLRLWFQKVLSQQNKQAKQKPNEQTSRINVIPNLLRAPSPPILSFRRHHILLETQDFFFPLSKLPKKIPKKITNPLKQLRFNAIVLQISSGFIAFLFAYMQFYQPNLSFGTSPVDYFPFIFSAIAAGLTGFGIEGILQYFGIPFSLPRGKK